MKTIKISPVKIIMIALTMAMGIYFLFATQITILGIMMAAVMFACAISFAICTKKNRNLKNNPIIWARTMLKRR